MRVQASGPLGQGLHPQRVNRARSLRRAVARSEEYGPTMTGYAVIDLETTGFAYNGNDRVVEIGVVHLDRDGRPEGVWTTLVNPKRDLGAQHIHGIDATDARIAPTFEEIAGDLVDILAGRVLAAHNSVFDASFLMAEYARAGWPLVLTPDLMLCTMRMARQFMPGSPGKLGDCCAYAGISLSDAHHALADAEAAAGLLSHCIAISGGAPTWAEWQERVAPLPWPNPPRTGAALVTRGAAQPGSAVLARVANRFERIVDLDGADQYLDLLDRVLLDRKISTPERRALDGLAESLGLATTAIARLNRHYMLGIVDAAREDDLLTQEERAMIIQLAKLLDLDELEVEALLDAAETGVATVEHGLVLAPGDLIVLTGMSMERKRELTEIAEARGLVVWPGVKKGITAVIAQDVGSGSGKASKAREYGVPVVGEEVLEP